MTFVRSLAVAEYDEVPAWAGDYGQKDYDACLYIHVDEVVVVLSDPITDVSPPRAEHKMIRVLSPRLGIVWVNSNHVCLADDDPAGRTIWERAQRREEYERSREDCE